MRDKSFNSQIFCSEVLHKVEDVSEYFLTTAVLISSKRFEKWTNRIGLKDRSQTTLVNLSILSWFMEPEIGILLRMEVQEVIKNNEDLFWIALLLQSKAHCLLFLQETQLWHTRDFFGNIFTTAEMKKALKSIYFIFYSSRQPRRKQRRRGYQDKGSWRAPHEHHSFYDGTAEQILLEENRSINQDTLELLQAFLE